MERIDEEFDAWTDEFSLSISSLFLKDIMINESLAEKPDRLAGGFRLLDSSRLVFIDRSEVVVILRSY